MSESRIDDQRLTASIAVPITQSLKDWLGNEARRTGHTIASYVRWLAEEQRRLTDAELVEADNGNTDAE